MGIRLSRLEITTTMAGPIIYVGNYGKNRLYHNNHDGTFTDIAETAGVTLGNWSTGPSFGDYDGDGRLDIFVPGYIHWDMNHLPSSGSKDCGLCELPVSRCADHVRPARPAGRAGSSVPQQWRRHLYRRKRESRRQRQAPLLRVLLNLCGHQRRRQSGPAGNRRFISQLSLSQQG